MFTAVGDSSFGRKPASHVPDIKKARPKGFEPLAFCSGGRRSIQLSYGRNGTKVSQPAVQRKPNRGVWTKRVPSRSNLSASANAFPSLS